MTNLKRLSRFAVAATLTLATACATSPTGRKQARFLPEGQLDAMGAQSFNELKKKTPISSDRTLTNNVNCVVQALLERNGFKTSEWEVQVFKDESVNAFAVPGKKIGVHTGIFKAAKNQDQLAAVLGHEIGHVIAQHGNERMSETVLVQGALIGASVAVDSKTQKGQTILALLGLGANVGIMLPFSRAHELEADEIGLEYMAKAGFDPLEARSLWVNMAKTGGAAPPELLSTHPSSSSRIEQIEDLSRNAQGLRAKALQKYSAPDCY